MLAVRSLRWPLVLVAGAGLLIACTTFGSDDASRAASGPGVGPPTPGVDGAPPPPDAARPDAPPGALDANVVDASEADASDGSDPPDTDRPPLDAGSPPLVKRVFVTTDPYPGMFGAGTLDAQDEADALCAASARAGGGGLGSTWRAYVSLPSRAAVTRLPLNAEWHLPAITGGPGDLVFASRDKIVDGPLTPINVNVVGVAIPVIIPLPPTPPDPIYVWTGTNATTTPNGSNCSSWTAAGQALCGNASAKDATWTASTQCNCEKGARLYCFEI